MSDILVRKVKLDVPADLDDVFPGEVPDEEFYRVAFSLTLPYLEPYLIRVYRKVVDQISDPALVADVQAFIGQEAQHHRNHKLANDAIKAAIGPDAAAKLTAIEDDLAAEYKQFSSERSLRFNLVYAEGFEAMTCAWATTGFELAERGEGSKHFGPWQQLWAWHAAEEIEHRTVAFQVYEHLIGSYPYRVFGSMRTQLHFLRYTSRFERVLYEARGLKYRPNIPRGIRKGPRRYLRTFGPHYHPADIEPRPLVATVLATTPTVG